MSVFDEASRPAVQLPDGSWMRAGRVVRWIDGDTAIVDTMTDQSPTRTELERWHIRLLGVNTPESNSKDPLERARAHAATSNANLLAAPGTFVDVVIVQDDKYGGRVDGHVIRHVDGVDVAQAQIAGRFGLPYDGGAR